MPNAIAGTYNCASASARDKRFYKSMTIGPRRCGSLDIKIMKTKLCFLIVLLAAALAQAQTNDLTALLQQGLFEEQANRNLDAAIASYQSLAAQFDKDRQLAATAVFRMGECYRMQGKTNEAAANTSASCAIFPIKRRSRR